MSVASGNSEFVILPTDSTSKVTGIQQSLQQDLEKDILWFRDLFLGKRKFDFDNDKLQLIRL